MIPRPLYGGGAAAFRDADVIALGRFRFAARWRVAGLAKGVTIHVFGPARGMNEEVLRFDCFDQPAHYRLGWSYRDEPFILD